MILTYKGKKWDTDKSYKYTHTTNDWAIEPYKAVVMLKLVLKTYSDGEGYGTMDHYGYCFVITKIISSNIPHNMIGWDMGTLPDLCEVVENE